MRELYREQLDDVLADLAQMAQEVSSAVNTATTALLDADLQLAEQVISGDEQLDLKQADIERRSFDLLALQAPVAGELRVIVASLRMVAELERMGDLAAHVAKIARLRYPESAVPDALRPSFVRMGDVAEKMVVAAGQTLSDRNVQNAEELRDRDQEMDDLRRYAVPGRCSATTGPTASRRPSTSPCWAGTTSGSPTTPRRWPAGSSTW